MKLSPLFIFLLLVIVLVISVIFCRYCMNSSIFEREGFVSYEANVAPTNSVKIPQYGPQPVIKMFDNLFFDQSNGNVVEVDSKPFMGNVDANGNYISGNVDVTGASISNLYISTRDGTEHDYAFTNANANTTQESTTSNTSCSYNKWAYNTKCQTTGKYQMFYIPWNTDTYVHIVQTETPSNANNQSAYKPVNVYTYQFASGSSSSVNAVRYLADILPTKVPPNTNGDPNDNQTITDNWYSTTNKVYQLAKYIEFDTSNGNLIMRTDNSITVYGRAKNVIVSSNTPLNNGGLSNTIPSVSYNSWITYDADKTTQVVYIAKDTNTLVLLIQMESSNKFKLVNAVRFDANGPVNANCTNDNSPDGSGNNPPDGSGNNPPPPSPDMSGNSDYYKWYWYWNSPQKYSDDYILKTQVVPPVCPTCPNCPDGGGGTCTNCGGQGGSGTKDNNGSSMAGGNATPTGPVGSVVNNTVDAAGNVIGSTVNTAGSIVNTAIDTTGKVVSETVGAAANVANNLINAPGYVPPPPPMYGQPGYGTPPMYGQPGYGTQPGYSTGADYSYYGALPPKGANFMPITADFSAFGK